MGTSQAVCYLTEKRVFGQLVEDVAQVTQGIRDRLQEMGFALTLTTITVGAEYLECTEEDEVWKGSAPSFFIDRML